MASETELRHQLAEREAKIARLERINQALMQRIEQGSSPQLNGVHSPFTAFQHAAVLAEQVRERTRELKHSADVSKQKALAEKMLLLQNTVDNLSQGVALVNGQGQLEVWNAKLLDLTGLSRRQLGLTNDFQACLMRSALSQPQQIFSQTRSEQKLLDGRTIAAERHPLPDAGYLLALTDISTHVAYAASLAESERWLRAITDNVPAMIAYLSANGIYEFVNRGYAEFYLQPGQEILQQHITEIHGESGYQRLQPYIAEVLNGDNVVFEITETNIQGVSRHLLKSYVPNRDSAGKVLGFFVLNRDITERKRTSEALRQANILLEKRVQERTAALSQAKNEAEIANASKSQFLAAVSHDVLQPLNAARLFNGAMLDQSLSPEVRGLAQKAARSLDDVGDLLRTLVDLSKLDAGALAAQVEVIPVDAVLKPLADEAEAMLASKGIRLRLQSSRDWIITDSALLTRILRNFISNAYRYTPAGGEVLLGCRRRGTQLEIQVLDTGPGIAADQRKSIFREFHRLPAAEHEHAGGLGLGLAIVERLARLLDHVVDVKSKVGRGSMFSIQVPRQQADQSSDRQARRDEPSVIPNTIQEQGLIGVIDNDPAICQALESILSGWGYTVVLAQNREQLVAQDFWQDRELRAVIVDYHLGADFGTDVVTELLQQRLSSAQPAVLLLTANHSQALQDQARELGFELLHKPVRPLQLRMTLRTLFSRSKSR
ncbi:PAS domain-containing hybrid sensor histidine kinase/response regulator [Aliidiomarina haloalkalitolerans]|uniref:histidine kinase n=1 Tax=Aliidiomarina haloalkalitolerans TaxID=859059 RepID=A0A432VQ16_9GAMM|nr:PAS domain-containing hybrid sensor histidine kinase/response regulator [Aliidiomarina haloalkalitolerans]MCL4408954.1 PAS domain-containing protein [Gammaproteobacteria bacterium]RUO18243.1 hybrid sensor histidine kinase/response regulator [Aliidiomarina haloalkalitolerans]